MNRYLKYILDRLRGIATKLRHRLWDDAQKIWIKLFPNCAVCASLTKCQVHHIKAVHEHPEEELKVRNYITLCRSKKWGIDCHLLVGHVCNFKLTSIDPYAFAAFLRAQMLAGGRELVDEIRVLPDIEAEPLWKRLLEIEAIGDAEWAAARAEVAAAAEVE